MKLKFVPVALAIGVALAFMPHFGNDSGRHQGGIQISKQPKDPHGKEPGGGGAGKAPGAGAGGAGKGPGKMPGKVGVVPSGKGGGKNGNSGKGRGNGKK